MLLPDPLDPTSAVVDPAGASERDVLQHRHAGVVLERHILELDFAAHVGHRLRGWRLPDLRSPSSGFHGCGRARRRPRVICVPMIGQLDHRHRDQRDERKIRHEIADRHGAVADRRAADEHHRDADRADDERRKRPDRRHAGQRLRDVAEQTVRALGEDQFLALFSRVGLDDADAAERFAEPAGDFGVDLAALTKERAKPLERRRHAAAERAQDDDRDGGQPPVQVEQDAKRHDGGQDRAGQLHQARADQVPDAFGVGHDARDQDAALRRVEVADGQAHDVRFDVFAHVGDRALRGDAENLRVGERARPRPRASPRLRRWRASAADPSCAGG